MDIRNLLISIIIGLLLVGGVHAQTGVEIVPSAQSLIGLTTRPVERKELTVNLTVPGRMEADPTLVRRAMAKASGRAMEVMISIGDTVQKGDPLAAIDSRELGEAWALYRRAQATLQLMTTELIRLKQPEANALVTQAELKLALEEKSLAQLQDSDAQAGVIQAQARFDLARANLERLKQPASQSALAQAIATMKLTKAELDRKQQLHQEKIAPQKELEAAQTDYENSKADYEYRKLLWEGDLQAAQFEIDSAGAALRYQQWLLRQKLQEATAHIEQTKTEIAYQQLLRQKQIREAEASVASARVDLAFAEEQLRLLGIEPSGQKHDTQQSDSLFLVRSPLSGRVVRRQINEGEIAKEGEVLFEIMDLSSVQVWAEVPATDLPSIHPGQPGTVILDAVPDVHFEGKVDYIAPRIAPETRTASVRIGLENTDGRLRPGMFARVTITTQVKQHVLAVPETALLEENGTWIAFVKTPQGSFVQRTVQRGIHDGDWVEVLKGFSEGERVVIQGAYQLKNRAITAEEVGAEED